MIIFNYSYPPVAVSNKQHSHFSFSPQKGHTQEQSSIILPQFSHIAISSSLMRLIYISYYFNLILSAY